MQGQEIENDYKVIMTLILEWKMDCPASNAIDDAGRITQSSIASEIEVLESLISFKEQQLTEVGSICDITDEIEGLNTLIRQKLSDSMVSTGAEYSMSGDNDSFVAVTEENTDTDIDGDMVVIQSMIEDKEHDKAACECLSKDIGILKGLIADKLMLLQTTLPQKTLS